MIRKFVSWFLIFSFMIVSMVGLIPLPTVSATANIKLLVNGKDITSLSAPVIDNDRTLVPVRFIAEELNADVVWDEDNYTVTITRGNRKIFLTIGSHLVEYDDGDSCIISDVAPRIINDRTYVPIRLISNAFGIGIYWDDETRTVSVQSDKVSKVESFYDVHITSISHGDSLSETVDINLEIGEELRNKTNQIRFMLLDKGTTQGLVLKKFPAETHTFQYSPSPDDNGKKTLAIVLYDKNNNFIAGNAVSVEVNVIPNVSVTGANRLDVITKSTQFGFKANFPVYAVKYEIVNVSSGRTRRTDRRDPQLSYSWTPVLEENGICIIQATVYDKRGNAYSSEELPVIAAVTPRLSLAGVSEGMTINKPVHLIASRNFDVNETIYLMRDTDTGILSEIATVPYGSYEWFPGPELSGEKELCVKVLDTKGDYHQSDYVKVNLDGTPKFIFKGLGPGQVLTSSTTLSIKSNVTPDKVRYKLTDRDSGESRYLNADDNASGAASFIPHGDDNGLMRVQAEAIYNEQIYTLPAVDFKVYLGTTYGPKPIIEKNKFLEFASEMAIQSMESTGMSAALQTAQAILETGWGQSVPVDKYSGQFSHNLFGVKGTGTKGSVISNTWEVYNGVSFRTDASFRAFNNVDEAWADHKRFLLELSRYETFRSVMHDCAEGAWALKRAGYATDPLYAIKLLDIINRYDLRSLDKSSL